MKISVPCVMAYAVIAGISALIALASVAIHWFWAYDTRFRVDSNERKIQAIWNRLNKDRREETAEIRETVAEILNEYELTGGQPDVGEQVLMMLMQQGMMQQRDAEPGDRFQEIDSLLGHGGDPGDDGDTSGQNGSAS